MQKTFIRGALTVALLSSYGLYAAEDIEVISILGARQPIELSKLSASVSIIDRQQIEDAGVQNVSDLLRSQAGLHFSQDGGKGTQTQLRLRGSEANHVLVLVDGVEINDLSDGGVNFAHLTLDNIERIEILRGPQSALWGSGALSGVINITTLSAKERISGGLKAEVGQNQSRQLSANIQTKSSALGFTGAVSHGVSDGQNISRQGDETDGFRNNEVSAGIDWALSVQSKLIAQLRHQDTYNEFDNTDFITGLPADSDNFTHGRQSSGKVEWQYSPADSLWSQSLGLHYSRNNSENFSPGFSEASVYDVSETDSDKLRFLWQNNFRYGAANRVTLALEHVEEDFTQRGQASLWGDPNQKQQNQTQSAIFDVVQQLSDALTLNGSLRQDNNQVFEDATTYRVGLSYQFNPLYRAFASYGKAIKNPTFIERFGYTPDQFIGNPGLRPEEAVTSEVGLSIQLNGWRSELSLYSSQLEDEINGYVYDVDLGGATSVNIDGESDRQGLEWQLFGQWQGVNIALNYSYLDASQGDEESPEVRRPKHSADLALTYTFLDEKADFFLQINYLGSRQDLFFPPPSYQTTYVALPVATILNAAFHYRLDSQWKLSLRADNLLDKDYEELLGYRRQGRTLYVGAVFSF
ncbi:TonB-dependent receptor [Aliiglaciecola sp. CAU 1673]|uniref:TonB-dependent receptor domain-containing protein n=1 Tax=Aliiglaciecola sp. CAU 1673 TaxID=3032595 RepID=UPI0023DCC03D|nr:TonB-dependent receptor [Aliiglaciecola sp. CAU 1673]MDF2179060.1 TonB-dependent receptor [Aliiglaciecola sp. CAU 1673]